jgi:putative transposase
MGRSPRLFVPGFAHHIVQRGHNRNAVFVEDADYSFYLDNLIEWKTHYNVDVYAYCLMTNHVHLILVPNNQGDSISRLMRRLSARQGRRVNRLEERIGTLWSGRFKSSVIDTDNYLLACLRYVELNPVRAGIVNWPEDYRWSSYTQRIGICGNIWIDEDPVTKLLGNTTAAWRSAYARYVQEIVPGAETKLIRKAAARNQLTGSNRFVDEIERRTGMRVESRGRGRPKNKSGTF